MSIKEESNELLEEAKSLLAECYYCILGVTGLDSKEDIRKAREKHNSSLIRRVEKFINQDINRKE